MNSEKPSTIHKIEENVKKEETKLQKEIKKEEKGLIWFAKSHTFRILLACIIFAILVFGVLYIATLQGKISVENSQIQAPIITLSSANPGILDNVYVKEGDKVQTNMIVASVNGNNIKAQTNGIVTSVQNTPGQLVSSQTPIVQMINLKELRVVGRIQEDKGLKYVQVGQKVIFTADAFNSKKYIGTVESISPSSRQQDIVFSISSNRQESEFNVYVKYDINSYPELKSGMSAKMWIYK